MENSHEKGRKGTTINLENRKIDNHKKVGNKNEQKKQEDEEKGGHHFKFLKFSTPNFSSTGTLHGDCCFL